MSGKVEGKAEVEGRRMWVIRWSRIYIILRLVRRVKTDRR